MEKVNEKVVVFLPWSEVEPEAKEQILNTSAVPFLFKHLAVMPDTHYGMGSTIGTVLATKEAIIPAAVGVDIGCGMISVKTNLVRHEMPDLGTLREHIERGIPMSAGKYNTRLTDSAQARISALEALAGDRLPFYDGLAANWRLQLGTLGGGNHFIEICIQTENGAETPDDQIWVTLHSGSRGIGNKIAMHHIKIAQAQMKEKGIELGDKDLAFLSFGTPEFAQYIDDLLWAQQFALANREEMMDRVMSDLAYGCTGDPKAGAQFEVERINCHHNFTQIEEHFGEKVFITRKGAIEASVGKKGMIPGSMGTRSYIVRGLGNPMSYNSAPHGAGRRLSRTKAKAAFTMDDFREAMKGIEHRESEVLLDELPLAYKDIDKVMENAKELVEIEAQLKQILNVKGD